MATYGGPTWLQNQFVIELLLPFILVFVIVFAILQKAEIFGKGKKQIDVLVALVIGLLFIAVRQAVGIVLDLIPLVAIGLVIILLLFLLVGSVAKEGDYEKAFPKWLRLGVMIVAIIFIIIAVLWATGLWNTAYDYFSGEGSNLFVNLLVLIIVGVAIAAVVWKPKSGGGDK